MNITKVKIFFSIMICQLFLANMQTYSQLSEGGIPRSLSDNNLKPISRVSFITMPSFDVQAMLREDSINQLDPDKVFRFAKGFNVSYSLDNSGTWDTLNNGDKIWRLGIKSLSAYSINIIFSEYKIPQNAKVFIFSQKASHIIGAFTSRNNTDDNILATAPVKGDEIIVEYFEPQNASFKGKLTIGKISHDYKGVTKACFDPPEGGHCYGLSGSCEVDINCSQGTYWQNEKHAVCRLFINGDGLCTGSLINNTANNYAPYLLTANHCVCSNAVASTVVTVFNYESPVCNGGDGSIAQNNSLSHATLRANWITSDFALLQLNTTPPISYNPYYLGWNRSGNAPATPVTCIHHPRGDVKKISVSTSSPNYASWDGCVGGCPLVPCDQDNYKNTWHISTWTTGATEGGSSGSPLFDGNHRVVGQLYGGASTCTSPHDDYFGQFSSSWIGGGSSSTRLSNWLDPSGLGGNTLNGLYTFLSGPTVLCNNGNGSYIVNNVPSGYTITWSSNLNLTRISSQGSNPCIFQMNSNGASYVSAKVKYGNDSIIYTLNLWLGIPQIGSSTYTNKGSTYPLVPEQSVPQSLIDSSLSSNSITPNTSTTNNACYLWYVTTTMQLQGQSSVTWSKTYSNPSDIYWTQTGNDLKFYFYSKNQTATFTINSSNSCGSAINNAFDFTAIDCGSGCTMNYILAPNPASTTLTITPDIPSPCGSVITNPQIKQVTIYDNQGSLKMTSTYGNNTSQVQINISSLNIGTYIIDINDGTNSVRKMLMIQR